MESDPERVWSRPSAREGQSVVWSHYDIELPEKKYVKCKKCPNKIFKYSGSTRCMWYHLEHVHHIHKPARPSQTESATKTTSSSSGLSQKETEDEADKNATAPTTDPSEVPPPNTKMKQVSIAQSFARNEIQSNLEKNHFLNPR